MAHAHGVDADHAGFDGIAQDIGAASIFGETIGGQPEWQPVGLHDGIIDGAERLHQRERPEWFLVHGARSVRHVGQHRGLEEKPCFARVLPAAPLSSSSNPRAGGLGIGHQRLDGIRAAAIGQRTHGGCRVQPTAHRQRISARGKASHKAVVNSLLYIKPGWRHADLAGIAELERADHRDSLFEIAIVKHQHRAVAAQLHGGALHALGGQRHEMLADRHGAGEADLADDRRCNQMARHLIGHAKHHADYLGRHTGIQKTAGHGQRRAGCFFGRLDDHRTASGERGCQLARWIEDRKIPRAKRCGGADRLAQHQRSAAARPHQHPAIGTFGFTSIKIHERSGIADFGAGFGQRLALFKRGNGGNMFAALAQQSRRACQHGAAFICRCRAPDDKAVRRCRQGTIKIGRRRQRQFTDHAAGGGIDHAVGVAAAGCDPFAADHQRKLGRVFAGHCHGPVGDLAAS